MPVKTKNEFMTFCRKYQNGCGSEMCSKAKHIVMSRGKVPCDVLFIGEAPGESEDSIGVPFIGPAGKLLDEIIEMVTSQFPNLRIGFTNIVACIPRDEDGDKATTPDDKQVKQCKQRLVDFVRIAKPRLIVLAGDEARYAVMGQAMFALPHEDGSPYWLRGKFMEFAEIKHPAYIIRQNVIQQDMLKQRAATILFNAFRLL